MEIGNMPKRETRKEPEEMVLEPDHLASEEERK